jgi:PAS domain-containing protein
MNTTHTDHSRREALRLRAVEKLQGPKAQAQAWAGASAALGVLYDLASSPSTASGALAVLHELQVHQVEVDLQDEELRRSRLELEASLNRQVQLYDFAPMGYVTLDANTALLELNLMAATLLGSERDSLRGRSLEDFLTKEGVSALRAMLGQLDVGGSLVFGDLQLRAGQDGLPRSLHASACPDPAGGGVLIGMIGGDGKNQTPAS